MKRIYTVQHTQSEHHTNGMVQPIGKVPPKWRDFCYKVQKPKGKRR